MLLAVLILMTVATSEQSGGQNVKISNDPKDFQKLQDNCCSVASQYIGNLGRGLENYTVKCDYEAEIMVDEEFNITGAKQMRQRVINQCRFVCQMNETDSLDEDCNVLADESKKFIENSISDEDMKKGLLESNAECARLSNLRAERVRTSVENRRMCNPAALLYYHCLIHHIFLKCPDENQSKSKKCIKLINSIKAYYDEE